MCTAVLNYTMAVKSTFILKMLTGSNWEEHQSGSIRFCLYRWITFTEGSFKSIILKPNLCISTWSGPSCYFHLKGIAYNCISRQRPPAMDYKLTFFLAPFTCLCFSRRCRLLSELLAFWRGALGIQSIPLLTDKTPQLCRAMLKGAQLLQLLHSKWQGMTMAKMKREK